MVKQINQEGARNSSQVNKELKARFNYALPLVPHEHFPIESRCRVLRYGIKVGSLCIRTNVCMTILSAGRPGVLPVILASASWVFSYAQCQGTQYYVSSSIPGHRRGNYEKLLKFFPLYSDVMVLIRSSRIVIHYPQVVLQSSLGIAAHLPLQICEWFAANPPSKFCQ